jgi:hypothetical protein
VASDDLVERVFRSLSGELFEQFTVGHGVVH